MDRQTIVTRLQQHAPELRSAGVLHLRLFGSAARDEMHSASDVDLLVDFDPAARVTMVTLGRLQQDLCAVLDAKVDLSATAWMHDAVRSEALREAVLAF